MNTLYGNDDYNDNGSHQDSTFIIIITIYITKNDYGSETKKRK